MGPIDHITDASYCGSERKKAFGLRKADPAAIIREIEQSTGTVALVTSENGALPYLSCDLEGEEGLKIDVVRVARKEKGEGNKEGGTDNDPFTEICVETAKRYRKVFVFFEQGLERFKTGYFCAFMSAFCRKNRREVVYCGPILEFGCPGAGVEGNKRV